MKIEYYVFRYYPSFNSKEFINIGVLYNNVDKNIQKFDVIKEWSKVSDFDDKVDIDFLKGITLDLKERIENGIFNINNIKDHYVNELKFEKSYLCEVDDFEAFKNSII